jgi:broad specificity phosphatase PhoE
MEKETSYSLIAARHGKRFKRRQENLGLGKKESPEYPGLTIEGVEEAQGKAINEILPIIEESAPGTVIFLGATSELERTRSTANVFADAIAEKVKDEKILFIDRNEIKEVYAETKSLSGVINHLKTIIDNNKGQKIIIDFPLFLKGLSMAETKDARTGKVRRSGLITLEKSESGREIENLTPYADSFYKENNYDEAEFLKTLIESGEEKGLDPAKIAEGFQNSIDRLVNFFRKNFDQQRHLNVIAVDSSGWMEWLAVYLANKGKIDQDGLQQVFSGKNMAETEFYVVDFGPEKVEVSIRDKKFVIDK